MSPRRPYLLKAFYDWLLDNDLTPHLVVDIMTPGVSVPMEYASDGQIVLNIAPRAVGNFVMNHDEVAFNARFGGVPRQVNVPMAAVIAIYARENGAGTMFEPEDAYLGFEQDGEAGEERLVSLVEATESSSPDDNDPDNTPQPPRGRPALRVVK